MVLAAPFRRQRGSQPVVGEHRMQIKSATVFGASGFLGRYVVRRLAADGVRIRAAVRDPDDELALGVIVAAAVAELNRAHDSITGDSERHALAVLLATRP